MFLFTSLLSALQTGWKGTDQKALARRTTPRMKNKLPRGPTEEALKLLSDIYYIFFFTELQCNFKVMVFGVFPPAGMTWHWCGVTVCMNLEERVSGTKLAECFKL